MFRLVLVYVSVTIGALFLAVSVLISVGIWLEAKDRGWLALRAGPIQWWALSDAIVYGSLFACLGALLLFDGIRELQYRANRRA